MAEFILEDYQTFETSLELWSSKILQFTRKATNIGEILFCNLKRYTFSSQALE